MIHTVVYFDLVDIKSTTYFVALRIFFIPDSFLPSKLEYPGGLTTEVTPASSGSIYKGKQYLYTGRKFVLSYKEEEVLELSTQMPRATGNYPIIIHMVSDQGDAGSYNLNVIIT